MSEPLHTKLKDELAEVGWRDLRQHAGRGALFLVRGGLETTAAAAAIARDDQHAVETWLAAAQLERPSTDELCAWESELDKRFEYLIVQPFVIAREV